MTVFKALGEFVGFLLTSTGSILVVISILLLAAHIAAGGSEPGATIAWGPLVLGLGMSAIIAVSGGVLLLRVVRDKRQE